MFCNVYLDKISIKRPKKVENRYGEYYSSEDIQMEFGYKYLQLYYLSINTSVNMFDDYFESFVTEIAPLLFPKNIQESKEKVKDEDAESEIEKWYRKHYDYFTSMGCIVVKERKFSWHDMQGLEEVKEQLMKNIIEPIKREGLYRKVASKVLPPSLSLLPRGVLLYGPPGCGKTWSMKVISSEANIPVVILPFSSVLTKWYGESENILRNILSRCKEAGKMVLLIDELDALARHRTESYETTARLVSILLTEMDGLSNKGEVLIVGAVNDIKLIDPAILDRFDIKIEFKLPNYEQLRAVFKYYARHLKDSEVDKIVIHFKDWNFRKVAKFCQDVVRNYISGLDLSQLEAEDPPLPGKEHYLRALERHTPPLFE